MPPERERAQILAGARKRTTFSAAVPVPLCAHTAYAHTGCPISSPALTPLLRMTLSLGALPRLHHLPLSPLPPPTLLPSCCRSYLDAMLTARDMKSAHSPLAQRMEEADRVRLVRERFMLLKGCVMVGKDDPKVPYLYQLGAAAPATH